MPPRQVKRGRPLRWARVRPGAPVVSNLPATSPAAEQYRKLAVEIEQQVAATQQRGYFLVVTSPEAQTGKTLTSLNLALTLAQGGERRVLLVEGDLWRPSLPDYLLLEPAEPGLAQLIEGGSTLRQSLAWLESRRGTVLDLLPAGGAQRSEEFAVGARITKVLAELRSIYEVVVIDCPPLLLSSGRVLATHADGVVVVVRARKTKKKDIEEVLSVLGPEKVLGMVLNCVRRMSSTYYYYSD